MALRLNGKLVVLFEFLFLAEYMYAYSGSFCPKQKNGDLPTFIEYLLDINTSNKTSCLLYAHGELIYNESVELVDIRMIRDIFATEYDLNGYIIYYENTTNSIFLYAYPQTIQGLRCEIYGVSTPRHQHEHLLQKNLTLVGFFNVSSAEHYYFVTKSLNLTLDPYSNFPKQKIIKTYFICVGPNVSLTLNINAENPPRDITNILISSSNSDLKTNEISTFGFGHTSREPIENVAFSLNCNDRLEANLENVIELKQRLWAPNSSMFIKNCLFRTDLFDIEGKTLLAEINAILGNKIRTMFVHRSFLTFNESVPSLDYFGKEFTRLETYLQRLLCLSPFSNSSRCSDEFHLMELNLNTSRLSAENNVILKDLRAVLRRQKKLSNHSQYKLDSLIQHLSHFERMFLDDKIKEAEYSHMLFNVICAGFCLVLVVSLFAYIVMCRMIRLKRSKKKMRIEFPTKTRDSKLLIAAAAAKKSKPKEVDERDSTSAYTFVNVAPNNYFAKTNVSDFKLNKENKLFKERSLSANTSSKVSRNSRRNSLN